MAILVDVGTPVIIQGMTGQKGRYYSKLMIAYSTNVVAGVTPGKGGEWVHGIPIFDTVGMAIEVTNAKTSVIFVPASEAMDSIFEAIDAGIELIICITEHVPLHHIIQVYHYLQNRPHCRLIGPNCPGILIPDVALLGIIPPTIAKAGTTGVVSRSGTLSYEIIRLLTQADYGQSACVGIGGDSIVGTRFVDVLEMFEYDPETERVILIGEIGGQAEQEAAEFIKSNMTKPVYAYLVGRMAPPYQTVGHAGAIIRAPNDSFKMKEKALTKAGVYVAETPEKLIKYMGYIDFRLSQPPAPPPNRADHLEE